MPFILVTHEHQSGDLSRSRRHWQDREEAAQSLCDWVEEVADGFLPGDRFTWVLLLRAASIAAATGYVIFEGICTITVIEAVRPEQSIEELEDRVRRRLAEIKSCGHSAKPTS
ncbi:hypothetical protein [Actinomadura violacea]|uniref:Uncharacterized protein n=1 Tax=Actinomadura violacea TaxID=2819934 RepID=A0ABS3RSV2_9ACTN|nr:hypothetical protein [Actinomadura violacea]MBO2459841.1 hypothetical protein [Actinomadura violacea]